MKTNNSPAGLNEFVHFEDALRIVDEIFQPLEVVKLPLMKAQGHVLARDVICVEGHPPFNRSAMDGFALRAEDIKDGKGGNILKVISVRKAGAETEHNEILPPKTCVKIMTGAVLPPGADTVVMQEDVIEQGDEVIINTKPRKGENVRFAGEDIPPGGIAVPYGSVLSPAKIATLALSGVTNVEVIRKPQVAVAITGDELTEPDQPNPPHGCIRNSNGPLLLALLSEMGIESHYFGIVPDDESKLEVIFHEASKYDLFIITGGVSVGKYDYIPGMMEKLNFEYLFRKVRVKPGKPVTLASGQKCKIFGLPGNPVSTLTSFFIFVKPSIRKMMGLPQAHVFYTGELSSAVEKNRMRYSIVPCKRKWKNERFTLEPVKINGSGDIAGASKGDSLAIIPSGDGVIEAGSRVRFAIMEEDN